MPFVVLAMYEGTLEIGTEKEFMERNHDLVEKFLVYRHLNRSEYYDVVIFAYMDAARDYLSNAELQRKYKFSTIANRRMWFAYCKEKRHEMQSVRYPRPICVDSLDEFGCTAVFGRESISPVNRLMASETIKRLMPYITKKEMEVVQLRAQGYPDSEIAGKCGISRKGISSRIYRMRKRIREKAVAV